MNGKHANFEAKIPLAFRGESAQMKKWTDVQKLAYSMQLHEELHRLYMLICKLVTICLRGGWRMIIENPYTQPHYLTTYFPIRPTIIDKDRTLNGDYFKKPTQYWFLNCEPTNGTSPQGTIEHRTVSGSKSGIKAGICSEDRSMISPDYARNFICDFILGKKQEHTQLTFDDIF